MELHQGIISKRDSFPPTEENVIFIIINVDQ
jgi:hypothetical protein